MELAVDGAAQLSPDLVAEVSTVLDRCEDTPEVGWLRLRIGGSAEGRVPPADYPSTALLMKWEALVRRFERAPVAVAAELAGDCYGVAIDLLLAADHRAVRPPARVHVSSGDGAVLPTAQLHRLVVQASWPQARHRVLFGGSFEADECLTLGLVDCVDPSGAVTDAVVGMVDGRDVAFRRKLLSDTRHMPYEEAIGVHSAAYDRFIRQRDGRAAESRRR